MNTGEITATGPAQVVVLDGTCTLPREDIGGKAWSLNRMRALGLPVPPAIVVTTHACREHHATGGDVSDALWTHIVEHMKLLEEGSSRRFAGTQRPLLVSVRSGAAHSMPGMMDTILNLGINDEIELALAAECGDARYGAETHRRFIEQYRKIVLGGRPGPVPADPWAQLRAAVAAVFQSWHSPRAQVYRRNRGLTDDGCTAVTIQAMVFGNLDARSGTGVLFSRNPVTGDPPAWGEWLARAQGEDVVSGRHTPEALHALRASMPRVHADLMQATAILEADARDIQDIEFTVESERVWLLQSRVAKRSPQAAVRAAVAFAEEGLISTEEAVRRLSVEQVRQLSSLRLAPQAAGQRLLAVGEAACPGVACGVVVTDPEDAEVRARHGEDVILARATTSPDDLHGIIAARALMTEQGGATSHAAVVSRELGRPCVVGCGSNTVTLLAGQRVTLDGASGRVWAGNLALDGGDEGSTGDLRKLVEWGMPLIPMRLLKMDEAPADTVDLDAWGENWRAALAPGIAVRGRVLETEQGIRAALAAGVRAAVVRHRLPALLACLRPAAGEAQSKPARDAAAIVPGTDISELSLLRLVGLKGRASADVLADALSRPADVVAAAYLHLREIGLCTQAGSALRLTAAGRDRLALLLGEERRHADPAAVLALYEDFCVFNAELKRIMTAWQLKDAAAPNDHRDADYDAAVLRRLAELHGRAVPLVQRLAALSPRLAQYGVRLARAAARVAAGDHSYVAKLIVDSYHTVWFELHEDLISLAGLTRRAEMQKAARPQSD
ncbi:MAG TPA: pyruvate, phosphate dikinase [Burkholderiales bacterium]|nr:pyruvate, phosphate dikinase [Burkholderiales bacterium]